MPWGPMLEEIRVRLLVSGVLFRPGGLPMLLLLVQGLGQQLVALSKPEALLLAVASTHFAPQAASAAA